MKVKELIKILKEENPEDIITVVGGFAEYSTDNVSIDCFDGKVLISEG